MYGGIAVTGNILCLAYSDVAGRVFLADLDEKRPVAFWEYVGTGGSYADAGGIAMAEDHSIYVADTRNDIVRSFSVFGKAVGTLPCMDAICKGSPSYPVTKSPLQSQPSVKTSPGGIPLANDTRSSPMRAWTGNRFPSAATCRAASRSS